MLTASGAGQAEAPRLDPDLAPLATPLSRCTLLAERSAWSLVWLAVITGGVNLWGFWWWSPAVVALAPLMVLGGLLGLGACWLAPSPRARWFQGIALGAVIMTALFPTSIEIRTRKFYATDSAAFDQVAAHVFAHGGDPYVASMSSVARFLSVPSRFWTYTVDGGHVSHFSYPAGSFLLNLPASALDLHMAADWTDLVAWIATTVLLFALLPVSIRWLAALVGLSPFLLGSFSSGGTDALFLPFLVVAVWRWDRYGRAGEQSVARWIGPIALGVACAVKQTPWFAIPMLVVGIYLEARRSGAVPFRLSLRYLLTVIGVFLALNLPFLAWHPGAWWQGTLIPLTGGLVADGQGLVTLATHGLTGGVNLDVLSLAGALAMTGAIAAFVAWYPHLKRIWPLLVVIPFFFSPRSLSSYLVDLFPIVLVAALSVDGVPAQTLEAGRKPRSSWLRPSVAVFAVSCVGVVVASFVAFSGPPLQLTVRSIRSSDAGTQLDAVTVSVVNRTSGRLVPHFLVNTTTSLNYLGFWTPSRGHSTAIGPHGSETLTLYPPAKTQAPQRGAQWLVLAYTTSPSWLSTSSLVPYAPST